jgi:hypothetical protein
MAYVSGREAVLADRIERNNTPSFIKDLLKNYQNYLYIVRARISVSKRFSYTVFTTLQGALQKNPENKQKPYQEKKNLTLRKLLDCLCGKSHRFKDCVYLIKKLREVEWTLNKETKR